MREDIVGDVGAQTRVGVRQSLARDGNEQAKAMRPSSYFAEYGCECASGACEQMVSLSIDEYEEVRSVPTHFVVAHGHVDRRVELVVRETARYQVVEKLGVAAKVASRLDPQFLSGRLWKLGS
jgi:hypothetical protein